MAGTGYVESYRGLIVYQRSRKLAETIFKLTQTFPREETYSLTDQVRRSSRSIGAQIAEAWAKRAYEKRFASKLSDADGEAQETRHWIEIALDCGYISMQQASDLLLSCDEIGRMLGSMILKAHLFCLKKPMLKESASEYLVEPTTPNTDL